MTKISASLLSCRDNLDNIIKEYNELDIDLIHLDIMDGFFVPNTSFTNDEISKIVNNINKPLDVHLMVNNPSKYIDYYKDLNVEYITYHYETKDIDTIKKIKEMGIKVGISIKPNTKVEEIYDLLPLIDLVLVMSVEPGKGGQEFMMSSLEKIEKLKKQINLLNLDVLISVDGGINNNSASKCKNSGVDILVIGTSLEKNNNRVEFIRNVKMKSAKIIVI